MTFCRLPVTVPNVYSYDDGSARAAITDARLVVGSVTKTPNCTLPRGDVVTQGPAGGTMVTLGSSVNLVESTGKQANGKPCIIE
jgi:beta-lactam-binding protein with PASTA domain